MDVHFACMPYAPVERPSIALGLLKAGLEREGITSSIKYAGFEFAELIGAEVYWFLRVNSHGDLAAEWTFAAAAFPDHRPDPRHFLDVVAEMMAAKVGRAGIRAYFPGRRVEDALRDAREKAAPFVDRTAKAILRDRPRIVACSSVFQQHCASLALLRRARELDPDVVTLLGGPNCEGDMGAVTHESFPWVDYVVSGEADLLLPDLCRLIFEHGRDVDRRALPDGVYGPAHRLDAAVPPEVPRAVVSDLDACPVPDYVDYFEALRASSLREVIEPGLLIETSRGCWWGQKQQCLFCGVNGQGMEYRSKSPDRVAEEFEALSKRHGMRHFEAVDNILDLDYVDTLFPVLAAASPGWVLAYEVPAILERRQVESLARAGVRWMQPGIESMHDDALRTLHKANRVWKNVQLLKWAREFGINVYWMMLCRFPGERDEWSAEMAGWLELLFHLQPPGVLNPIQFARFSPYHRRPEDFGLRLRPPTTYGQVYPLTEQAIERLAYYYDDADLFLERGRAKLLPGQRALLEVIFAWRAAFRPTARGESALTVEVVEGGLRVRDVRPCAVAEETTFSGLAAAVLTHCDVAPTRRRLLARLNADRRGAVSWDEVAPVVADLRARKLLLTTGGRYISLPVRPATPLDGAFPGGRLDLQRILEQAHEEALRRAARWREELSIEEAFSLPAPDDAPGGND